MLYCTKVRRHTAIVAVEFDDAMDNNDISYF